MNPKTTTIVVGAGIGAGIGYFVGSILVEYIIAKEEMNNREEPGVGEDRIKKFNDRLNKQKEHKTTVVYNHKQNEKPIGKTVTYNTFFNAEGKPELAVLAAKYAGKDLKLTKEDIMSVDDPRWDDANTNLFEKIKTPIKEEVENEFDEDEANTDLFEKIKTPIKEEVENEFDEDDLDLDAIRIVSFEEFTDEDEYVKVNLKYFIEDEILVGSNGEPIIDPEDLIGDDALVSFGVLSHDENVVYVVNDYNQTMTKITRVNASFKPIGPARRRMALSKRNMEENGKENHSS